MPDLSLDDLRRLPKGLGSRPTVKRSELGIPSRLDVLLALGLVSVCTTCERTGKVASAYNADQTVFVDCPDCVDGLVVSPEAIERMRQVIHNTAGTGTGEDGYQKVWVSQHAQEMAALGLRAALGIEKT